MNSQRRGWSGARLALLLLVLPGWAAAAPPRVIEFTPQGVVKNVRQVRARFSSPMVAFGDPRVDASAFTVDCPASGTPKWLDTRTWAFDFETDLPAGLKCSFRTREDLHSRDGGVVAPATFTFSTGGPSIQSSNPYEESEDIDEEQAFALVLDGEATPESVVSHVSFAVEGLPERVGVWLVDGETRTAVINTLADEDQKKPIVVLQAKQRFPSARSIKLIWGPGVAAPSGVATTESQELAFTTRSPFTAQFYCERENARADCIPLKPMNLGFTTSIPRERAVEIVLVGTDGKRYPADLRHDDAPQVSTVRFLAPFPESSIFHIEMPSGLIDDTGRELANAAEFPLEVKTDKYPPLAKFAARFGILESKADPALPVTVRNLEPEIRTAIEAVRGRQTRTPPTTGPQQRTLREQTARASPEGNSKGAESKIAAAATEVTARSARLGPADREAILPWLRTVGRARRVASVFSPKPPVDLRRFGLPKPNGPSAFEVIGIPLEQPGLYIVELSSRELGAALLGKDKPMYVAAAALVTNMAVHFKWGRENSLAWVTALDTGDPVGDAEVAVLDCHGKPIWKGIADSDGLARIPALPPRDKLPRCHEEAQTETTNEADADDYDDQSDAEALNPYLLGEGVLVVASNGDDVSFVHSGWDDGIEPWRFQLPVESYSGPVTAHTVFDRVLFRAGETVHMKHILRSRALDGFAMAPESDRPVRASIEHEGSDDKYELPLTWNDDGSAEMSWTIPPTAKLGRYRVVLVRDGENSWMTQLRSGSFRVEEFRVPLMKATVQLPSEPQVAVSRVPANLSVQYLAGGPAAGLPVVLRAQLRPKTIRPGPDFEHFTFANGPVAIGTSRDDEDGEESGGASGKPAVLLRQSLDLDDAGTARATIGDLPSTSTVRELLAELEYRDPNGEVQTSTSTVPLWPSTRLVGIVAGDWADSPKRVRARVAVIDTRSEPVADAPVRVEILPRRTYSYRKRLVGGFYAYEHVEETGPAVGVLCEGTTDSHGILRCEGESPVDGNIILQASSSDADGHVSIAHDDVWVRGVDDWWFRVGDTDRMDLLPERSQYAPGDTARLQVRMPFREATALVTVEREGIADSFVTRLSGREPVVEVPLKGSYAPNVFISVLAVRGRVGDVQPTATVDLGRPAFKLGIAELRVGWQAHELTVDVKTDREVYRVRERAKATVNVRTAGGQPPPAGSQVAIAAVDEGLLELSPNTSWDLLTAMMGRRGYGVRTASDQMHVVGKRHFGLKALPQGGGGGRQATRELFNTLLLWNARVPLDDTGNATVEIPLNDSLTSFRIAAVATSGTNLFGTGSTSIRSTQDLMLLSGLPPLVREGDRFRAEFTLRNTTERALDVSLGVAVKEIGAALPPQTRALSPGAAEIVGWDITVPADVRQLHYEIDATAGEAIADHLSVVQSVQPAVPVRAVQGNLLRAAPQVKETVERPADALPGRGGIQIGLAPTLAAGLDGVRDWMRRYPYTCLEQRVSRAVALGDATDWRSLAASLPGYVDANGLLKFFPGQKQGSDALTAYVLSISQAAQLSLPAEVRSRMADGLRGFVSGTTIVQSAVDTVDLPLRKLAAAAALARAGESSPSLLDSIAIEPDQWPTSAVLDWWSFLKRERHAAKREARLRQVEEILRARLDLRGTTMQLRDAASDAMWWLMVCPDTSAARLVLEAVDSPGWKSDIGRLVQGLIGLQRRGAWSCTVTNAWGALAVQRFAKVEEARSVTGTTTVELGERREKVDWSAPPHAESFDLPWPPQSADLSIEHRGSGAPWVSLRSLAAIPLRAPLENGYRVRKTIVPLEQRTPGVYSRGDILRIRLEIDAQSEMTWVVVDDPIPGGASHLGTGLGRDAQIASTSTPTTVPQPSPAFVERSFAGYRAYYDFVPAGSFAAEYVIRLNQDGHFEIPPTRVEALYAPDVYGETPNAAVEVAH